MEARTYKLTRSFLAWRKPGEREHLGKVELIQSHTVPAPDAFTGRTAETITIPAGSIIEYLVVEEDPLT